MHKVSSSRKNAQLEREEACESARFVVIARRKNEFPRGKQAYKQLKCRQFCRYENGDFIYNEMNGLFSLSPPGGIFVPERKASCWMLAMLPQKERGLPKLAGRWGAVVKRGLV